MDRFQSLTRMCLNNWHYINEKVLSFHEEINFFTGHSGSGKSTVLDALQIVLYADTNGRGFFNKAAKEDSDRTLIEYLRGMKVVQEDNKISYLRNKNFSSTIVLEFQDTETGKYQSLGVIFDVDVSVNDINRLFFWHGGKLLPNCYRDGERVFSVNELREHMKENYPKEEYYFSRTNEKFRNELYSSYFGGLHPKHFPALFKKAIPFKMDMKLEEFVKNYICTENDIHIDDMQDSAAGYTRLKRRLEDTKNEIRMLTQLHEQFEKYHIYANHAIQYQYNIDKLDIKNLEGKLEYIQRKQQDYEQDVSLLEQSIKGLEDELVIIQKQRDEVMLTVQNSGYDSLEAELKSLNQVLEFMYRNKAAYDKIADGLKYWLDKEVLEPAVQEGILHFSNYEVSSYEIEKIKSGILEIRQGLERDKEELSLKLQEIKNSITDTTKQIITLQNGQKAYPSYLLEAKDFIRRKLEEHHEEPVQVDILADVLEVKDERWLNAIEGYMGNNKLGLIVPPKYAKEAMELYQSLDSKKYYKAAVIDTEKVLKDNKAIMQKSLAEEVETELEYARAYVDFLLGAVIKCDNIEETRENKSGITSDCVLYQGYKLQHINHRNYTEYAYIGRSSIERRLRQLEHDLSELQIQKRPLDEQMKKLTDLLSYEILSEETDSLIQKLKEIHEILNQEKKKQEYEEKIKELKEKDIDTLIAKQRLLEETIHAKTKQKEIAGVDLRTKANELKSFKDTLLTLNEELLQKQNAFSPKETREATYLSFMKEQGYRKSDSIRFELVNKKQDSERKREEEFNKLVLKREEYRNTYSFRGFSLTSKDNEEYEQLLETLISDKLIEYTEKAGEQAKQAIYHFKTDFVYKIRDAIKEVMQQKEDLNRILAQLDFGKDKYRFIITKNRGEDGKFYDMFMDENLDINPHQLSGKNDNQMDIFSLQHEKDYSNLINELIELFMPPENSDPKLLEEARMNMEKYADYRTYLSFDMEQLVEGMPPMRLSKMLTKNSGGEGQNPLYVALLASFAQVYRINLKANMRRRPTPRLVVLDEAFSKMDAEKVGSSIRLIRKLGFQAVISATNDKIQNYVDNVDKTFVFANPNKNRISIQEFEKKEFQELLTVEGDGEDETA